MNITKDVIAFTEHWEEKASFMERNPWANGKDKYLFHLRGNHKKVNFFKSLTY